MFIENSLGNVITLIQQNLPSKEDLNDGIVPVTKKMQLNLCTIYFFIPTYFRLKLHIPTFFTYKRKEIL